MYLSLEIRDCDIKKLEDMFSYDTDGENGVQYLIDCALDELLKNKNRDCKECAYKSEFMMDVAIEE